MGALKTLQPWKVFFSKGHKPTELNTSLLEYLQTSCEELFNQPDNPVCEDAFLEYLQMLLQSTDPAIYHLAITWVIQDFIKLHKIPLATQGKVFDHIRVFDDGALVQPLLAWLETPQAVWKSEIPLWLSDLNFHNEAERQHVIRVLVGRFLKDKSQDEPNLLPALKRLDMIAGEVTDTVLFRFPSGADEENERLINLLGSLGRYRVVKPLIAFCKEYSRFERAVIKALKEFSHPEVDQFFLSCLTQVPAENPMALIEAIKQVRKRRLRKAMPLLDDLFPVEGNQPSLINRAINGEIALTMASFGAGLWGREKLMPQMFLEGVNQKYLKAVDLLNLEDAIPLLKAILLAPEIPSLLAIQHQAYTICERLLATANRRR